MDSNAPRRYDEQEVSMILEQASQLDTAEAPEASTSLIGPAARETGRGLTLAELQAIGEEAGISAVAVTRAANAIARGDHLPPERQSMLGLPVGVARTVVFDRRVTDAEWERLVVLFRRTFGTNGVVRGEGSLREWGNGRLRASLEPTASTTSAPAPAQHRVAWSWPCSRFRNIMESAVLPGVATTVWISLVLSSTPMWAFMP